MPQSPGDSPPPDLEVQLEQKISAEKIKTIFVLVPFKLVGYSYLAAVNVPDVASTVGRLFTEGRLEVTDATLAVWACYPRELAARGDFSEAATRHRLHEELEPHIRRLRDLPPIRPGSGESCTGVRPFREVEFRMCPYDEWHAGGIAEIPEEVWEAILKATGGDSNTPQGTTAEARTGEARTAEDS